MKAGVRIRLEADLLIFLFELRAKTEQVVPFVRIVNNRGNSNIANAYLRKIFSERVECILKNK